MMASLVPPSASWMPRRNSGWLSRRATRMRSAKRGLQLIDFELRRIGDGIGTDFHQELAPDRLDAIVEGAQPLWIVLCWGLVASAFHYHFEHLATAFGAHSLQARALIQRLTHEAVEAGFDGKRDLLRQAYQVAKHRTPGTALMAAHSCGDRVGQRELIELGGNEALRQIANVIERFSQCAANGLDIFALGLARTIQLSEQGPQRVELEQSDGDVLHGSAEKLGAYAPHMQFIHVRNAPAGAAEPQAELVLFFAGTRNFTGAAVRQDIQQDYETNGTATEDQPDQRLDGANLVIELGGDLVGLDQPNNATRSGLPQGGIDFEDMYAEGAQLHLIIAVELAELGGNPAFPGAGSGARQREALANHFAAVAVDDLLAGPDAKGDDGSADERRRKKVVQLLLLRFGERGLSRKFLNARGDKTVGEEGNLGPILIDDCPADAAADGSSY